jgi:hypothetical protein
MMNNFITANNNNVNNANFNKSSSNIQKKSK